MSAGIELAPLVTRIEVDTKQFEKDMEKAAQKGKQEAEKVEKSLAGVRKVGESLSNAGSLLTKGFTLPIAALGTATTKMAVDFGSSFAKVSTLLDDGVVDFSEYKDALIEGSNDTKVAVNEYSEAVYQAISAGVDQRKAVEFTTDAMKLAKGGFTSGASAVDILTTAINGYNLSASDATKLSDMLITTQNLGKTTVDELSQSMGKVIPIASSVNFGMNELSASYAQLTKNGIATAEAGTYLKQMLSELGKTGSDADKALKELTGSGFAELKQQGMSTSEILNLMSQYAEKNGMTLKDMFSSVEAGSAALVLAKGNGEEYNEMLSAMNQSAGATQAAFDKMDATPAEQLKGALNELRNAGIKFGASFLPILTDVTSAIGKAADKFGNMSEEERKQVIQMLAVTAAIGPMLKATGNWIETYAKLAPVITKVSAVLGQSGGAGLVGNMTQLAGICAPLAIGAAAVGTSLYAIHEQGQLMNRTVVESSDDMSLMEKALAKLQGVEVKSRKELEKLGVVHKEFSKDISKEFQKSVEKSTEELQNFSVFLREIGLDDVITEEENDAFEQRIADMCNQAISTIQSKKDESQSALRELFVADDGLIDESEQRVLDILSESSDKQIKTIQLLQEQILDIKQNALDEGRALSEEEIAIIEEKTARIRQIELMAVGGTQEEILYAKKEFAERVKTMDAESASELLQEKAKTRDEEIIQIKASYDTQIELLKQKAAKCTGADKAELEKQIANLEEDRQKKIDIQNNLYEEYMDIIKEKNPNLVDLIDKYNGQILTNADKKSQELLFQMMDNYDGLNQITESGCYQIYNKTAGMWQNMKVVVDENTGAITGIYNESVGTCAGYTEQMAEDAKEMADSQSKSYEQIGASLGMYVDKGKWIVDANGNIITSMDELKAHTDGTRTGIINLNGTPYNITVNKDGTISALRQISAEADYAARNRTIRIGVVGSNVSSGIASSVQNAVRGARHFNGLDNVPYDGYRAVLHKGERVLTAEENKNYSMGANKSEQIPKTLRATFHIGKQQVMDAIVPIVEDAITVNAELAERGV